MTTSNLQSPQHTYTATGTYTVTLVVSNCASSDTTTEEIMVIAVGLEETDPQNSFTISPNPFSTTAMVVLGDNIDPQSARLEICDLTGRTVQTIYPESQNVPVQGEALAQGVYFLRVYLKGSLTGNRKIILQR